MKKIFSYLAIIAVFALLSACGRLASAERKLVCEPAPKTLENGRMEYPRAAKYEHVQLLGQLFTADACGSERLKQIDGVAGENYIRGSTLFLQNEPPANMLTLLKEIGYSCVENKVKCMQWGLNTTVKVDMLLKLEPYVEYIRADDCRMCG